MPASSIMSGLKNWFDGLSPEVQRAMIAGGFDAAGAFMTNRGIGQENEAMRQERGATNMADLEGQFRREDAQGARDVLSQTRMGEIPSTYGSLAMRRALFESLAPGTTMGNVGGMQAPAEFRDQMATFGGPSLDGAREQAMKYFSDDALQADLARRLSAEGRVDPNGATFDMTSIFGEEARPEMDSIDALKGQTNQFIQSSQDRSRRALQQALQGQQGGGEKQKGTPWWKKALGIGLGAAGLIAAPFTGGVSTALIGAGGALAGSKLMGGSNQDALMAALGGSTAGFGARGGGGGGTTPATGNVFAANYAPKNPLRNVRLGGGR